MTADRECVTGQRQVNGRAVRQLRVAVGLLGQDRCDRGESIDVAAERLKSLGVKNVGEVQRDQGGSFVHFHDPDGNELYLWESAKWS